MDVIYLAQTAQSVEDCVINVSAQRAESIPKVFTHITLSIEWFMTLMLGVKRAVELSKTYCSVSKMLSATADITYRIEIVDRNLSEPITSLKSATTEDNWTMTRIRRKQIEGLLFDLLETKAHIRLGDLIHIRRLSRARHFLCSKLPSMRAASLNLGAEIAAEPEFRLGMSRSQMDFMIIRTIHPRLRTLPIQWSTDYRMLDSTWRLALRPSRSFRPGRNRPCIHSSNGASLCRAISKPPPHNRMMTSMR